MRMESNYGVQRLASATRSELLDSKVWTLLNGTDTASIGARSESPSRVDNVLVFESAVSPKGPLGLVIWIDNQYAAFTPEGKIGFGVLENPEPAWLEVKDIVVT